MADQFWVLIWLMEYPQRNLDYMKDIPLYRFLVLIARNYNSDVIICAFQAVENELFCVMKVRTGNQIAPSPPWQNTSAQNMGFSG